MPTTGGVTTGPTGECGSVDDCAGGASACRTPTACEGGVCVFEAVVDGTPIGEQVSGDCMVLVCDGAGGVRSQVDAGDVEDDGMLCTLDGCDGTTPTHMPGMTSCYSGARGTAGVGMCVSGVKMCDEQGTPVGPCVGEVLPQTEDCDAGLLDEDCDGEINEEGAACICVPGEIVPCYGGPPATQNVGVCKGGGQSCDADGLGLSECAGEVLPGPEDCETLDVDEDCDGVADCEQRAVQLAVGQRFSCARFNDGKVKCWGANTAGQLGLGDKLHRGDEPGEMGAALPFVDLGPLGAVEIAAGEAFVCARLEDGTIKCWGSNNYGVLGVGDTIARGDHPNEMGVNLPAFSLGDVPVVHMSAGDAFMCALLADGSVKCWGYAAFGRLGLGDSGDLGNVPGEVGPELPVVPLGAPVVELATGASHTCVRFADDKIKCWGLGSGALGLGSFEHKGDNVGEIAALPFVDLGPLPAKSVRTGNLTSCAVMGDQSLRCWGSVTPLGFGDPEHRGDGPGEMGVNLPAIAVGGPVETLLAADRGACVRLVGGTIKCWGANAWGQLGLGDTEDRGDGPGEMGDDLPALDLGLANKVLQISRWDIHACALFESGAVKCWGHNLNGQLGLGDKEHRGDNPGEMGAALPSVQLL
ncbi:RCC1 domain-containing protein [Nannocystis pusilla]|uniref:RCC1 domain-containing protein n=1 Tax=Nannocystis pusilla TaxID=889268 RepID=UPI003DA3B2F2